ncbi:hypothetical protein FXE84_05400 [Vibrio cholerae]|uniref:hypothetical protein n=1 Tax=Vibrio cholerae TaxID=666 RepID=UPI0004E4531B|nr:hypothetical protein [Vibrio cholerae]EJL6608278.1 hypothetical protein [Vibrio cholerae]EJL6662816.1 hypothetical protein [Vibrio cholerae]EKZ8588885.1 hypothetical protein [Vibrio cholerae]KFE26048.1 hypothetical protein DN30_3301 [Vibrio cholerae]TXY43316.1 hypothetical protein FXE84_05400 [Vibrio cholerae]
MNKALIQLKLRERQLTEELEQIWTEMAMMPVPEISLENIPLSQVIDLLKLMILEGEGDWLVGPVERVGDTLVTSAKALRIASQQTGVSYHLLLGSLSRAQRGPRLSCKGYMLTLNIK